MGVLERAWPPALGFVPFFFSRLIPFFCSRQRFTVPSYMELAVRSMFATFDSHLCVVMLPGAVIRLLYL